MSAILRLLLVVCFLLLAVPSRAQEDAIGIAQSSTQPTRALAATLPGGMHGRISLDLRNIEIVDALKFVAMKAGLNIVTTRNVTGRVTLMVEDVPVQDIFDIMLRSNELAYAKEGEIYNVMTEKEYEKLYGKSFADLRQVRSFRLNYAIPEQAFSLIDTLKSKIGRVLVEPDSGTVLIMDTPEKIEEIEDALTILERKNLVRVFDLKYARAKDVETRLKAQLNAKNVGSIDADDRSNQVIVQTFPERMAEIERLITALDKKDQEVLIDTRIVKIKLTDDFDAGVQWEGIFNIAKEFGSMNYLGTYPFAAIQAASDDFRTRWDVFGDEGNQIGSYPFSGTSSIYNASAPRPPGSLMHVGMIGTRRDVDLLVNYLKTVGNTQILSNPKLAVTDNQEARIHVGERQAYVTSTTTTGQTTSTVSEEVTFVDIGIKLAVTPQINEDGYVKMKIKPEVSSVVDYLVTPQGNRIPIIDTSMAETTVMIRDGATIVIGGLRKDEKTKESQGVPHLQDIPVIGFLFKSSSERVERTELLVLITPHIVSGDRLASMEELELGQIPTKEYQDYDPFTQETDLEPLEEKPEERIKSYRTYSTDKGEKEKDE